MFRDRVEILKSLSVGDFVKLKHGRGVIDFIREARRVINARPQKEPK